MIQTNRRKIVIKNFLANLSINVELRDGLARIMKPTQHKGLPS